MTPTYANKSLPVKVTGYENLVEVLEYAAQGETGFNFYDGRGHLSAVLSYVQLRNEARVLARRLLGLGCETKILLTSFNRSLSSLFIVST